MRKNCKKMKITLRKRLMFYLSPLILAALGGVLLILILTGNVFATEKQIKEVLENRLDNVKENLSEEMMSYTGYGMNLSTTLGSMMDTELQKKNLKLQDLNDDQEELLELSEQFYPELYTAIRMGRSSGVYAVVDATVNSQIPEAEYSRSGVYLRLVNVSSDAILSPEIILFRGNPEIAGKHGLEIHNQWNLEFNTETLPGYQKFVSEDEKEGAERTLRCSWSEKTQLKDTGEDALILTVPIYGSQGEIYGACGVEVNAMHFQLKYPAVKSKYGSVVTVVAPMEDGILRLDKGMLGNSEGTWLSEADILKIEQNKYYNTYSSDNGSFIGMQSSFKVPGDTDQEWVAAVMMPEKGCVDNIETARYRMIFAIVIFVLLMILLSNYMSAKFVHPILQSFKDIREDHVREVSGIQELEELLKYLDERGQRQMDGDLPPDIKELFVSFAEGVKTLTKAEYQIFLYYTDGAEIAQIPDLAFISMSTVKKHNRNIYEKLHVSSYHELMLYIDLFRRCGRLDELRERE